MDDLQGTNTVKSSEVTATASGRADPLAALSEINDGLTLRPYLPEDRPEVERICEATGLRGELDSLFCDRPLFVKLWLDPYLKGEPEHCVVVEQEGKIVGYLVGSVRPGFFWRGVRCVLPHMIRLFINWISGKYRHHPPSERFVRWFFFRSLKEKPRTPPNTGNFHFNLDPELVAVLVGERLIARFEEFVREAGLVGWHAILFSSPKKRPLRMYQRMGFTIYDQRPCTLFPEPEVVAACIYKTLDEWVKMARVPRKREQKPTPASQEEVVR